jgi:hypothetical protein
MSIINNLLSIFKSKPKEEPLKLDITLGDTQVARLRAELAFGDYRGAQRLLEGCNNSEDRWFYVQVLSNWPGQPRWIDTWIEKEMKNSACPWLIRGVQSIQRAWELQQKDNKIFTVGDNEKAIFQEKLQRAEQDLQMAAWLDPSDPTPWAYLIKTGLGLYVGAKEIENRFREACQRDPEHRPAHSFMMQSLSEKWGGLHALMFDFARNTVVQAKEGSPLHTLIAEAHVERWLFYLAENSPEMAKAYFRKQEHVREITKSAIHSIQSIHYRKSKLTPFYQNLFAFCFWQMGNKAMARKEFQNIGLNVTDVPWIYFNDPIGEFTRARQESEEKKSNN